MSQEILYYNAFNQITEIGAVRFHKMRRHFGSMQKAWEAPRAQLLAAGLETAVAEVVITRRPEIDPEKELKKTIEAGVTIITYDDVGYPGILKEIYNPPALLYVRGNPGCLQRQEMVAIVGTRKISPYGKQVTPLLARELAQSGITIVSGLAVGVDELAHAATVEAGGTTIAVLGSGIDDASIYPGQNRRLAGRIIASGGAVISELPVGSPPLKLHFPHRNRIIAGLALGTVVVEADVTSGALITARMALEQNRQIFAVPGSIFNKVSAGSNNLLKLGAKPVTAVADILEELNLTAAVEHITAREVIPASPAEAALLKLLSREPIHINQLIQDSGLPSSDVGATLTMMEMKGMARNLGAQQYVRAH